MLSYNLDVSSCAIKDSFCKSSHIYESFEKQEIHSFCGFMKATKLLRTWNVWIENNLEHKIVNMRDFTHDIIRLYNHETFSLENFHACGRSQVVIFSKHWSH